MKPIIFDECNTIYGKEQPQYNPLPAFFIPDGSGQVITCWELTAEEIATIQKTGKIWLRLLTFGHPLPPLLLTTEKGDVIGQEGGQENGQ